MLRRLYLDDNFLEIVPNLPSTLEELKISENRLNGIHKNSFKGTVPSTPKWTDKRRDHLFGSNIHSTLLLGKS